MEKINYHEQELEWIDGLLASIDSARCILSSWKQSHQEKARATCEQQRTLDWLKVRYTSDLTQQEAQQLIDSRCRKILESIVERGNRPDKGRPFFFLRPGELPKDRGEWL